MDEEDSALTLQTLASSWLEGQRYDDDYVTTSCRLHQTSISSATQTQTRKPWNGKETPAKKYG